MRRNRRILDRHPSALHWSETTTVVGPRFTFAGEIETPGPVVVAGRVEGPIHAQGLVHVQAGAVVLGSVHAGAAIIDGAVEGHVTVQNELELGHTGRVRGDLSAQRIAIAEGSYQIGHLNAGAGVMHFRERRAARRR